MILILIDVQFGEAFTAIVLIAVGTSKNGCEVGHFMELILQAE